MHHDQIGFIPRMQGSLKIHKPIDIIYHTNGLTNQSYIIILIYVEKAFHKIKLPFIIKRTLSKLEREGNLIKGISEKPTPNITISDERHFYPHFYSVLVVLANATTTTKRNSVSIRDSTQFLFSHLIILLSLQRSVSRGPDIRFFSFHLGCVLDGTSRVSPCLNSP